MLLQNLLIQIAVLVLGILAGIVVSWLAQEELVLSKEKIFLFAKIVFVLTLLAPLFFVERWLIVAFVALSYGVIAFPQKNEVQIFYLIAPLTLFLSTQNKEGFFVTGGLFLIATVLTTLLFFSDFVKKKQIVWKKEMWMLLGKKYSGFLLLNGLVYSGAGLFGVIF